MCWVLGVGVSQAATCDMRADQQQRRGAFDSPLYGLNFSALCVPDAQLFGLLEVEHVLQQQLNSQRLQQPLCLIDLCIVTKTQLRALRCPIHVRQTKTLDPGLPVALCLRLFDCPPLLSIYVSRPVPFVAACSCFLLQFVPRCLCLLV